MLRRRHVDACVQPLSRTARQRCAAARPDPRSGRPACAHRRARRGLHPHERTDHRDSGSAPWRPSRVGRGGPSSGRDERGAPAPGQEHPRRRPGAGVRDGTLRRHVRRLLRRLPGASPGARLRTQSAELRRVDGLRTVIPRARVPAVASARIRIEGRPAQIPAVSCTPLVLALHELATNAIKHGALSSPDGEVTLCWKDEPIVRRLVWRERGGPQVTPPTRTGLGRRLLRPQPGLDAVNLEFRPDGVVCEILLPPTRDATEWRPEMDTASGQSGLPSSRENWRSWARILER